MSFPTISSSGLGFSGIDKTSLAFPSRREGRPRRREIRSLRRTKTRKNNIKVGDYAFN